jgi:hypothetical protein
MEPGDTNKATSAPPYDVAALEPSASAAADSNTETVRQLMIAATVVAEHVMTLRDAEKAASKSPGNSDQMVVLLVARPEISAMSDLTGKDIAIDDRYSASSDKVRTAIAAAGAAEIQLSEGQTKAIDRLIRGEVPAAVLTLLYPETGFPEFAGFKIFRIPLVPGSPTARLKQGVASVARISAAISGVLDPHIATLMRGTCCVPTPSSGERPQRSLGRSAAARSRCHANACLSAAGIRGTEMIEPKWLN